MRPLLLISALICLCASTRCHAGRYESVWHLAHSRPDLSLSAYLMDTFPDTLLRLSDPSLTVTMFLPTDQAIMTYLGGYQDGSKALATRADAIKQLMGNVDLLYPEFYDWSGASSNRNFWWQVLTYGALQQPKALKLASLKSGTDYTTALARNGWSSVMTVSKSVNGTVITDEVSREAKVVVANLAAGKSIVHILDELLFPSVAPRDSFDTILDAAWGMVFADVIKAAADAGYDVDQTTVPMTGFIPTDDAVDAWLKEGNITMAELLADGERCTFLVKAHFAPSMPAAGPGLFTNDLLAMAAAEHAGLPGSENAYGESARHTGIRNLLGGEMQLKTTYQGLNAGPLRVGFVAPIGGSEPPFWGVVTEPVDVNGNQAGTAVVSVMHYVDKVLV